MVDLFGFVCVAVWVRLIGYFCCGFPFAGFWFAMVLFAIAVFV